MAIVFLDAGKCVINYIILIFLIGAILYTISTRLLLSLFVDHYKRYDYYNFRPTRKILFLLLLLLSSYSLLLLKWLAAQGWE